MCSLVLLATLVLSTDAPTAEGDASQLHRFQRMQPHMGTSFGIVLYAADERTANRAFEAAFARISDLDRICSDYDLDSELSRLSAQSPTQQPVPVSDDLYKVLRLSRELSDRTNGAFDITLGPVTKLWRRARLLKKLPAPQQLDKAMAAVGYRHVVLHDSEHAIELKHPHMRLDLGGIAKGYAASEALRTLRELGITRALVKGSGDILVGEPPPDEKGWRIDIAPLEPDGKPTQSVWLVNAAISTSGDAFQFLEIDGKRYSHILDPRTGYGLTQRSSVSVIAPTGAMADALATAVSMLGPAAGLKLIDDTPGTAAYVVTIENDRVKTYASTRFAQFTQPPQ